MQLMQPQRECARKAQIDSLQQTLPEHLTATVGAFLHTARGAMTTKAKEDKIAKLLKEIQRRPENKQCADCTSKARTHRPRASALRSLLRRRMRPMIDVCGGRLSGVAMTRAFFCAGQPVRRPQFQRLLVHDLQWHPVRAALASPCARGCLARAAARARVSDRGG